jgi:septal ring factor EnvC (AmiA/AmiB activator)
MRKIAAILACLVLLGSAGAVMGRRAAPDGAGEDPAVRLSTARSRVAAGRAEIDRLDKRQRALEVSRDTTTRRLGALLRALWPLRLGSLAERVTGLSSWAEADRRYVWLRALYAATGRALATRGAEDRQVTSGEKVREQARQRQETRRQEADAAFSGLVGARLSSLTPPGASDEETVAALGRALDDAAADGLGSEGRMCADLSRGGLAWPARGRVAAAFDPNRAGRRGLTMATAQKAEVRAAARGRVVFTGVLRRFGRVVILAHGEQCHTVYACLDQVSAVPGEDVDREAVLGLAGVCPLADGPGVYFELRFRKKALNPAEWFAANP